MSETTPFARLSGQTRGSEEMAYRSAYRQDYARVIHSPSFRRLQNKTQLFPGQENDFFRNRLTHSLEVAQIAKTIALKIAAEHSEIDIKPDVCEIAGLIHDLGHPPFGHNGESALHECMQEHGGFEGNAQTLRIIMRLEKKLDTEALYDRYDDDLRLGLDLTSRVIASALKYDFCIPLSSPGGIFTKGYYQSEKKAIDAVKKNVLGFMPADGAFKTIECAVMDLADDIAYSTYDIEDAFKANFLTPLDVISVEPFILEQLVKKLKDSSKITISTEECQRQLCEIFEGVWGPPIDTIRALKKNRDFKILALQEIIGIYRNSRGTAENGYRRTQFTSGLVNAFVKGIEVIPNKEHPILSSVRFNETTNIRVNILKHFTFICLINSPRLRVVENRGKKIVKEIFERLAEPGGERLLPEDFQRIYAKANNKHRVICDCIAGMTDRYALEYYSRLYSENPQTIFRPL